MNILEKQMINTLIDLKENYGAIGIKAEFEAEVDFIVDDGDRLGSVASTIVRLDSDGSYEVLRQGSLIV